MRFATNPRAPFAELTSRSRLPCRRSRAAGHGHARLAREPTLRSPDGTARSSILLPSAGMTAPRRLVVGISGASGAIYGIRLLEALRQAAIETHLVVTRTAEMTLGYETDRKLADLHALADHVHAVQDLGAPIASG